MPKKVYYPLGLMERLYTTHAPITEIVDKTGLSYQTVFDYVKLRLRIDGESGKVLSSTSYSRYGFKGNINPKTEKSFRSKQEKDEYHARHTINPETGRTFKSKSQLDEYQRSNSFRTYINPETGRRYKSFAAYEEYRAKHKVNPATRKPFKSKTDYWKFMGGKRSSRFENQCLSDLIKRRLDEMGKNQYWLAQKLGISRSTVTRYVQGFCMPSEPCLSTLFSKLKVHYKTLDDLLRDQG